MSNERYKQVRLYISPVTYRLILQKCCFSDFAQVAYEVALSEGVAVNALIVNCTRHNGDYKMASLPSSMLPNGGLRIPVKSQNLTGFTISNYLCWGVGELANIALTSFVITPHSKAVEMLKGVGTVIFLQNSIIEYSRKSDIIYNYDFSKLV